MSVFSERCRQMVVESESNVYEIARESGLERTALQRMIRGTRLPGIDFVERFFSFLRITPPERRELLTLYWMEKLGPELYENRRRIRATLEQLSLSPGRSGISHAPERFPTPSLSQPEPAERFSDSFCDTENLLQDVILSELGISGSKRISTNLPVTCSPLFRLLKSEGIRRASQLEVRQLLIINKATSGLTRTGYNLEVFCEILSVLTCLLAQYLPRYLYSKSTPDDDYCYLYPYYLITGRHLLLISSDGARAILHSRPEIIRRYQEEFDRLYTLASPLSVCRANASEHQSDLLRELAGSVTLTHVASGSAFPVLRATVKYYGPQELCHFPENLTLLLHGFSMLRFYLFSETGDSLSVTVTESGICKSFQDFLESLQPE